MVGRRPWLRERPEIGGRTGRGVDEPAVKIDVDEVVREYFDRIHRAALVLTGNPWDADDLAQETFLVLARQPERFSGRSRVFTWLYGILLNLERRERRRRSTRQRGLRVVSERQRDEGRCEVPAGDHLEVDEWRASLWGQVARLPDGQRQALVLRFSEGLTYEEIAQALEIPLGTVKSRLFHGLANLRKLMDEEGSRGEWMSGRPAEDVLRAAQSG
ncbi:MAG TPA: RNA polymerase sigma factor [Planctomycetaceae bacterium]|nr:RNA polymerase sigma factor [Planctomycetaceae bacterium]